MNYLKWLSIFGIVGLFSCQSEEVIELSNNYTNEEISILSKELNLPTETFNYTFGQHTEEEKFNDKATLGRVLFYDNNLSADASVSCASCHQQNLAFADNASQSLGANGNLTKRNSIALGAVRSFGLHYDDSDEERIVPGLFWDERAKTIKEQLRQTINNPNEMGMSLSQIVDVVDNSDAYNILHKKAFGETAIQEDHILDALEAFINSISSRNTRFENDIIQNLNFITGDSVSGNITNELGFRLFSENCTSCHSSNFNSIFEIEDKELLHVANNGLKLTDSDKGVFEYTGLDSDIGKFKIPGLLNIELTSPYMHDGRFKTLEEVVDFYSEGIEYNANLHPNLIQNGKAKNLNLNDHEKKALVNFLKSLTDEEMQKEEKWSNPFLG